MTTPRTRPKPLKGKKGCIPLWKIRRAVKRIALNDTASI